MRGRWTRRYRRYKQQHMHMNPGIFFVLDSFFVLAKIVFAVVAVFLAYQLAMQIQL